MPMFEGGCLCGAVRYRFGGKPTDSIICHCRSCQRASGASTVAWITVARVDFAFARGDASACASSPGVLRRFCGACGSPLTYENVAHPTSVDVTTASLDDPGRFAPTIELWLEQKVAWQALDPRLAHHSRGSNEGAAEDAPRVDQAQSMRE